jgi:hypothetical protein
VLQAQRTLLVGLFNRNFDTLVQAFRCWHIGHLTQTSNQYGHAVSIEPTVFALVQMPFQRGKLGCRKLFIQ